jgi:PmbA protein
MINVLPKGAEYELRTERTESSNVVFEGNKFDRITSSSQVNHTARVLADGKLSVASSSKPGGEEALLKTAYESVKYGSPYNETFAVKTDVPKLDLADEKTLSSKEMIEIMSEFVNDLKKLDERLTVSAGLSCTFADTTLKTSGGFEGSYRKSIWSWNGVVELVQGDDLLALYESHRGMSPEFTLEEMKETIRRKLNYSKNVVDFKAGAYPVIFTPREVGNIINPIIQSMNGQAIERGVSPWGDKLGQEMMDKRFTLVDDGSINKFYASKPFDFEGTPTRKNSLVQNGVLGDILTNKKVAAKLGRTSSGNHSAAGPAPHFLSIDPGTKTLDDLVKSIDYGLIIDGTMGAWSGNPFAGIVSGTIAMGLKVEGGKVVGRVKDSMFTVNAFEHFKKHLAECSSERRQAMYMFGSSTLFPYILLNEVVISTK